jgi:hypothetical protein
MGDARTVTVEALTDQIAYDLRNTDGVQYTDAEIFEYIKRAHEILYEVLAADSSDLVATGSGNFVTVAGMETYDLSSNSMGDFWIPSRITGGDYHGEYAIYLKDSSDNYYSPLEMVNEGDRYGYIIAGPTSRERPTGFYINDISMGLLPVPDAVYTVYIDKYVPNYVPLTDTSSNLPFKNLFNLQIIEAVKFLAKSRNMQGGAIETVLMEIFQQRALELKNQRSRVERSITVRYR